MRLTWVGTFHVSKISVQWSCGLSFHSCIFSIVKKVVLQFPYYTFSVKVVGIFTLIIFSFWFASTKCLLGWQVNFGTWKEHFEKREVGQLCCFPFGQFRVNFVCTKLLLFSQYWVHFAFPDNGQTHRVMKWHLMAKMEYCNCDGWFCNCIGIHPNVALLVSKYKILLGMTQILNLVSINRIVLCARALLCVSGQLHISFMYFSLSHLCWTRFDKLNGNA